MRKKNLQVAGLVQFLLLRQVSFRFHPTFFSFPFAWEQSEKPCFLPLCVRLHLSWVDWQGTRLGTLHGMGYSLIFISMSPALQRRSLPGSQNGMQNGDGPLSSLLDFPRFLIKYSQLQAEFLGWLFYPLPLHLR